MRFQKGWSHDKQFKQTTNETQSIKFFSKYTPLFSFLERSLVPNPGFSPKSHVFLSIYRISFLFPLTASLTVFINFIYFFTYLTSYTYFIQLSLKNYFPLAKGLYILNAKMLGIVFYWGYINGRKYITFFYSFYPNICYKYWTTIVY